MIPFQYKTLNLNIKIIQNKNIFIKKINRQNLSNFFDKTFDLSKIFLLLSNDQIQLDQYVKKALYYQLTNSILMNQNKSRRSANENCLKKLEALKKKINQIMQIRQDSNLMNKYRLDFNVTQPKLLSGGSLQQHQIEALQWMINLAAQECNGILADDMGLGKTIQAISYLAYLKEQNGILGKHLVICPKSVSQNWMRQINKWFPSSRAVLLKCTEEQRQQCMRKYVRPRKFDILVTTYEGAKRCIVQLQKIKWEVMIVDEAHKIKNQNSQSFLSLNCYQASFKLLLTGTPLSNNLKELWCLLFFIMPQVFNQSDLFDQIEQNVATFEGTEEEKTQFRIKIAKYFHQIINPFFKRRAKRDLELGLPQKIEKTLFVPLSKMQLQMYKNFLRYGNVYGEEYGQYRHQMNARKICLHPYLFDGMWPQQEQDFGQHAIQNCGKLKVLDKLLKKLLPDQHKILIFSQFTLLLDILEQYCEYRNFTYCRLDGSTSLEDRQLYMNDFNTNNKYSIFMLSTRAGGLGINLTGADTVIIYDIDWNPQNDIQAMDRAYRIGQKKNVHIYKLITEFTVEERMSEIQKYKLIWDELVIQKGTFMSRKKKDDPFANFNNQNLVNIGKGDIFRLEPNQNDKTIQEILIMGEKKQTKLEKIIREKLIKNLNQDKLDKINPFQQTNDVVPEAQQEKIVFYIKKQHQFNKRERAKFHRRYVAPPAFRFFTRVHKIRDLQFQIHLQQKKEQQDQNQKLLTHLREELQRTYKHEKFHKWSQKQFKLFIKAHQFFLRNQFQQIANFISTKTAQEVEQYSRCFFEKAVNNERLEYEVSSIMLKQKICKARKHLLNYLQQHDSKENWKKTDPTYKLCEIVENMNKIDDNQQVKRSINFIKKTFTFQNNKQNRQSHQETSQSLCNNKQSQSINNQQSQPEYDIETGQVSNSIESSQQGYATDDEDKEKIKKFLKKELREDLTNQEKQKRKEQKIQKRKKIKEQRLLKKKEQQQQKKIQTQIQKQQKIKKQVKACLQILQHKNRVRIKYLQKQRQENQNLIEQIHRLIKKGQQAKVSEITTNLLTSRLKQKLFSSNQCKIIRIEYKQYLLLLKIIASSGSQMKQLYNQLKSRRKNRDFSVIQQINGQTYQQKYHNYSNLNENNSSKDKPISLISLIKEQNSLIKEIKFIDELINNIKLPKTQLIQKQKFQASPTSASTIQKTQILAKNDFTKLL